MKTSATVRLFLLCAVTGCAGARQGTTHTEHVEAGTGTLVVQIEGLRSAQGLISVSLFAGAEGFPQDTAAVLRSATVELARTPERLIRFEQLEYGDYAIAVLHDENGNGAMDTGFLGVPSEGFGFSNNPSPGFGAPSFESCRFRLDTPQLTLQLQLRYF